MYLLPLVPKTLKLHLSQVQIKLSITKMRNHFHKNFISNSTYSFQLYQNELIEKIMDNVQHFVTSVQFSYESMYWKLKNEQRSQKKGKKDQDISKGKQSEVSPEMPVNRQLVISCILKLVTPWIDRGIESYVKEKKMQNKKIKGKKLFGNVDNIEKQSSSQQRPTQYQPKKSARTAKNSTLNQEKLIQSSSIDSHQSEKSQSFSKSHPIPGNNFKNSNSSLQDSSRYKKWSVLSPAQELVVKKWILKKFRHGQKVTWRSIQNYAFNMVEKARQNGTFQIGKSDNSVTRQFKATKGWVTSFFSRYPEVRQKYEQSLIQRKKVSNQFSDGNEWINDMKVKQNNSENEQQYNYNLGHFLDKKHNQNHKQRLVEKYDNDFQLDSDENEFNQMIKQQNEESENYKGNWNGESSED